MFTPKVLEFLIISLEKFVQKIFLNLIFINPGFAIDIFSIKLSFVFNNLTKLLAKSNGGRLFFLLKPVPH